MPEERKLSKQKFQNVFIENREKINITGVVDVDSFNDECVIAVTELGDIIVRGENLKISKLNVENAEMNIEGNVISCEYTEKSGIKGGMGFLGRLFK